MDQADAYTSALMQGERYRVVDDRLEILGSGDEATLVFIREKPLPGHPDDLAGTAWRLLAEDDAKGEARATTIAFLDDRLATGATACRDYLATYNAADGSVDFDSTGMLGTQSCSGESRTLEGNYTDFLTWAWKYSVYEEGGASRLGIRSSQGEELTFEPLPSAVGDIADVEWTLAMFVELLGFPRDTPVVQGTRVTASLDEDGISGTSGCNSYTAAARIGDGSVAVDVQSLSYTEISCDGPEGLMEQEKRYLDLLPNLTRYGIYGDGLFMQADDLFLLFQAE